MLMGDTPPISKQQLIKFSIKSTINQSKRKVG
jgi:hypothetical protein